ncbi:sulfotransferase family protein [Parvularcula lutaonensis]|uniref:Sulfotransferase family protein n=1 Tax=Parvularcula lutaonensis TaxID=491923 RepID=A0ABV7MAY1_9PROT|nr:sulfotransferase [Parvularcula lutaonensis]GGY46259.1 sulfotransferase family protein [Parvularcula lutaonensis]
MAHPLSGARLSVLRRVLSEAGTVDRGRLAPIMGSVLGRTPFTALEGQIEKGLRPKEELEPPIFLLGHWRSGTTHLYNVMSLGGFAYVPPVATGMPSEMLTLGKWLRPMLEKQLPDSRYIDNIPVTPTSPQEDEIALANLSAMSFYHGIYFPERFDRFVNRGLFFDDASLEDIAQWEDAFVLFMRKLDRLFRGRRILIKNPVYTARPAQLLKLFPGAKIVHIHRDPFDVFPSMQNFYQKLFPPLALQPYDHVDVDGTILRVYDRMMRQFTEETEGLTAPDYVEVAYADLNRDAIGTLETIYRTLDLPGFDAARPAFAAYLDSIKGYQKNKFRKADQWTDKVAEAWAPWLDRWGYEKPA